MDSYQVIKRPLHTEKSVTDIRRTNQYHFEVDGRATKHDVRRAIQQLFPAVHVSSVNVLWVKPKPRRWRYTRGQTKSWKKAIVKLRSGDTIDIGY